MNLRELRWPNSREGAGLITASRPTVTPLIYLSRFSRAWAATSGPRSASKARRVRVLRAFPVRLNALQTRHPAGPNDTGPAAARCTSDRRQTPARQTVARGSVYINGKRLFRPALRRQPHGQPEHNRSAAPWSTGKPAIPLGPVLANPWAADRCPADRAPTGHRRMAARHPTVAQQTVARGLAYLRRNHHSRRHLRGQECDRRAQQPHRHLHRQARPQPHRAGEHPHPRDQRPDIEPLLPLRRRTRRP